MPPAAPQLNQDQLKSNINAMEQQGAKPDEIQGYLDSLKPNNTPSSDFNVPKTPDQIAGEQSGATFPANTGGGYWNAPVEGLKFLGNIPSSAYNMAKGMTYGLGQNIGAIGTGLFSDLPREAGGASNVIPALGNAVDPLTAARQTMEAVTSPFQFITKPTEAGLNYATGRVASLLGNKKVANESMRQGDLALQQGQRELVNNPSNFIATGLGVGTQGLPPNYDIATEISKGAQKPFTAAVNKMVGSDVPALFDRALRPSKGSYNAFQDAVRSPEALQRVNAVADQAGTPIDGLQTASNVIKSARENLWNKEIAPQITGANGAFVDGETLAKAIEKTPSQNEKLFFENPDLLDRVQQRAKLYRGAQIDVPKAETFLEQTNAKLQSLYEGMKRGTISPQDVGNAQLEIQMDKNLAEALRSEIESKVNGLGGSVAGLKKQYGALTTLERAVNDRLPVNQRLSKFNLSDQINIPAGVRDIIKGGMEGAKTGGVGGAVAGTLEGIGRVATSRALKTANSADFQVQRAFELSRPSNTPPISENTAIKTPIPNTILQKNTINSISEPIPQRTVSGKPSPKIKR